MENNQMEPDKNGLLPCPKSCDRKIDRMTYNYIGIKKQTDIHQDSYIAQMKNGLWPLFSCDVKTKGRKDAK